MHTTSELEARELLVCHLQTVHATKAAAMRMFGPMLAAVREERREGSLPSVDDLLARMLDAFSEHCRETKRHEYLLRARLEALGRKPSSRLKLALGTGAAARAQVGRIGGQNHGANARDAFIFEHAEIACLELLERLAEHAGDHETATLASACRADDEAMAAKIHRNWDNVLRLLLASKGVDPGGDEAAVRPDDDAESARPPATGDERPIPIVRPTVVDAPDQSPS